MWCKILSPSICHIRSYRNKLRSVCFGEYAHAHVEESLIEKSERQSYFERWTLARELDLIDRRKRRFSCFSTSLNQMHIFKVMGRETDVDRREDRLQSSIRFFFKEKRSQKGNWCRFTLGIDKYLAHTHTLKWPWCVLEDTVQSIAVYSLHWSDVIGQNLIAYWFYLGMSRLHHCVDKHRRASRDATQWNSLRACYARDRCLVCSEENCSSYCYSNHIIKSKKRVQ